MMKKATEIPFLNLLNDAICIVDRDYRITDANQALLDLLRLSEKDIIKKYYFDIFPNDKAYSLLSSLKNSKNPVRKTYKTILNGQNFEITADPLLDDNNSFNGVFLVFRYLTREYSVVNEIRKNEKRFRSLMEKSPYGVHVYSLMPDKRLIFETYNESANKILGIDHKMLCGLSIEEAFPPLVSTPIPEAYRKVALTGKAYKLDAIPYVDNKGIAGNFELMAFQPQQNQVAIFFRDITEKQNQEQLLKHTLQATKDIFNYIPSGLFIYNFEQPQKLILSEANPEALKLTGLKAENILGREFNEIFPKAAASGLTDKYLNVVKTGKIYETEDLYYKDDSIDGAFRIRAFRLPGKRLAVAFENITEQIRWEQELKKSEERFRSLVNSMPDAILVQCNGRYVFSNPAAQKLLQYSENEIDGKNVLEVIHPDDHQLCISRIKNNEAGIANDAIEMQVIRKDGSCIFCETLSTPFIYHDQKASLIISHNISQRKTAENLLKESEERFKIASYYTGQLIYDYDVPDGKIHWAGAIRDITGYTEEEFSNFDIVQWSEHIHVEDRQRAMELLSSSINNKAMYHARYRFKRKDGTFIHIEDTGNYSFSAAGDAIKMIGTMRDITRQHKAELELLEKTRELESFFINSIDLLCIADKKGLFKRVNPEWEKKLGYTISELIGIHLAELVHPEDIKLTKQALASLSGSETPVNFINRFRHKNGSYRWLEWRSIPAGKLIYAAARDITDFKTFEEESRQINIILEQKVKERTAQLETSNRELEAFAYSVSHDLRAPLRNINGFSSILLEDYGNIFNAEARRHIERIQASTKYMGQLIDDLLSLSRISRKKVSRAYIDISGMVSNVATELKESNPKRKCEFIIPGHSIVYADQNLIYIVLQNLMRNAWKFSSKKPQSVIEFSFYRDRNENVYYIRDNGVGFDMSYVSKLFTAFNRLHNPADFEGSGIGLAIVQRIINMHGGRIWASAEINKGATFFFTLGEAEKQ